MTFTFFVMVFMSKPKRTDVCYKRFLYFHFFSIAIISEIAAAFGNFLEGYVITGLFSIFRIFCWCLLFRQGLKLRETVAKVRKRVQGGV